MLHLIEVYCISSKSKKMVKKVMMALGQNLMYPYWDENNHPLVVLY